MMSLSERCDLMSRLKAFRGIAEWPVYWLAAEACMAAIFFASLRIIRSRIESSSMHCGKYTSQDGVL